eukprot:263118-Rhodomonas_salina.4
MLLPCEIKCKKTQSWYNFHGFDIGVYLSTRPLCDVRYWLTCSIGVWSYATPGTDLAYAPTRLQLSQPVLVTVSLVPSVQSPISLCDIRYERMAPMPLYGGYDTTSTRALVLTSCMVLCPGASGSVPLPTNRDAYLAASSTVLSVRGQVCAYARATRSPVLANHMTFSAYVLCDVRYWHTA